MSLYPTLCADCNRPLRATAVGRACPECGQVFPSRDRELRDLHDRVRAGMRDREARQSLVTDPPVSTWEQLALFAGGAA